MAVIKKKSNGALLRCSNGALATNCYCDGEETFADCGEVHTYLLTVAAKSLTLDTAYTAVGDCAGCPIDLAANCTGPTLNAIQGVIWEDLDVGEYDYCGDTISGRGRVRYKCNGTSLIVTTDFIMDNSPFDQNECNTGVTLVPFIQETFDFPGSTFPVAKSWLDQAFELTDTSGSVGTCGCDLSPSYTMTAGA